MIFNAPTPARFPELVIGLSGPIGTNMELIVTTITDCLSRVNYKSSSIKLTKEMLSQKVRGVPKPRADIASQYNWKMDYANALRKKLGLADTMARLAIRAIQNERAIISGSWNKPAASQAYIIRQLKLPEEVQLLRQVYGRQFVLISAFGSENDRSRLLLEKLKEKLPTETTDTDAQHLVRTLMDRDASEEGESFGQNLRDTFHLGDVVIDGIRREAMKSTLSRFIDAFFGKNEISPNKDEFGMYFAKSSSLRSADLARQVGAAIFSPKGEVITTRCNEVPKAGGGTYWDQEEPDHRDIKKGFDPNDKLKKEIVRNMIERLRKASFLSSKALKLGSDLEIVATITGKSTSSNPTPVLADALVMDITEFGRVVHAEMNAICDAARTGVSVQDTTLYCTTFPCHNCTKHILASGIKRVVFMEPYPKSRAKELHPDELDIDVQADVGKVAFVPFQGISPYRFRDIFQKGKRKLSTGQASEWYANGDIPVPMLDVSFPAYATTSELWALVPLVGKVRKISNK